MTGSNLSQGPNELVFLRTSPRAPILLGPLELRPSGENNTTTRSEYLFYARSAQSACASAKLRLGAYSKNTPRCSAKIRITYSKYGKGIFGLRFLDQTMRPLPRRQCGLLQTAIRPLPPAAAFCGLLEQDAVPVASFA